MATAKKKKPGKVKFELARSAVLGIAVVVFCLFLWTFIFGVWAGQSMLAPQGEAASKKKSSITLRKKLTVMPQASEEIPPPFIRAEKKKRGP
ncbi:hypothetical protein CSB45_15635 [candidate division KSB3 bacterium]|uniref:Uncharacterized protein n=1 Tax=candidate division KSB3 bacterium TaxID=2044937 RepID=A0A2G6E0D1_9BACT|nr:MAG: hypothetical protein CSB45_15635 [candidate division KSB3 bacterium]